MATIMPTFNCFDDVVDFFNEEVYRVFGVDPKECVIVHAICSIDGQRFAHAFLECGDVVIDAGLNQGVRVFFTTDRMPTIERACRYTLADAMRFDEDCGPGPWDPEIKEICAEADRDGPSVVGMLEINGSIVVRDGRRAGDEDESTI